MIDNQKELFIVVDKDDNVMSIVLATIVIMINPFSSGNRCYHLE